MNIGEAVRLDGLIKDSFSVQRYLTCMVQEEYVIYEYQAVGLGPTSSKRSPALS